MFPNPSFIGQGVKPPKAQSDTGTSNVHEFEWSKSCDDEIPLNKSFLVKEGTVHVLYKVHLSCTQPWELPFFSLMAAAGLYTCLANIYLSVLPNKRCMDQSSI